MTDKEALSKIQAICSKQEKCSFDVLKKLQEWEISEDISQKIIKSLILDKFVDDERYSKAFVKDKFRFNKWGKIKISMQLRLKKIDTEIISMAIQEIDDNEYKSFVESELKKKRKSIKDTDPYAVKNKLFRFGQSKGIEADDIMKVIGNW